MRAQRQRIDLLGLERLDELGPQEARGAQLGGLHEEVHADAEEERQPRREGVDVEALGLGGAHVFQPIRKSECQLLNKRRSRLLHVIAGDRDRVELGHVLRGVLDDVGHDAHGGSGRIDIGVPDHELLEDVVLDRARELLLRHALLLGGDDVARQHRQHGAVHGHRHAHLVERDAVEQDLHVLDEIDRHARLADVADDARMVEVVAAVGGEIERHRQAHLAGREVGAIELVALLGGREAGVLAHRPGAAGIHGGLGPAGERREARDRTHGFEVLEVGRGVERLHRDALGGHPVERRQGLVAQLLGGELFPVGRGLLRKVSHDANYVTQRGGFATRPCAPPPAQVFVSRERSGMVVFNAAYEGT